MTAQQIRLLVVVSVAGFVWAVVIAALAVRLLHLGWQPSYVLGCMVIAAGFVGLNRWQRRKRR